MRFALPALLSVLLFSCEIVETPDEHLTLFGEVKNASVDTALVYGHNKKFKLAIDSSGVFKDSLHIVKDGLYTLQIGRERTDIYLAKGSDIRLSVDTDAFDESLHFSGDRKLENNYLVQKTLNAENDIAWKKLFSMPEDSFLMTSKNIMKQRIDFLESQSGLLPAFAAQERKNLEYNYYADLEDYVGNYMYLTNEEGFTVSDSFYRDIEAVSFNDTAMYLESKDYENLVKNHFFRLNTEKIHAGSEDSYFKIVSEALPKSQAKDELLYTYAYYGLTPDSTLEENHEILQNNIRDPEKRTQLSERYETLKKLIAGQPSPTFKYPNVQGDSISLDDLQGQYVYIDVWATWCGPCIREIPHLKEMEEEYADRDVAFVSISVDYEDDYDEWKQMIKDKELGGIQLFSDKNWRSDFIRAYAINAIPRFILIDTIGHIVDADAPRPSDAELRDIFEKFPRKEAL